MIVTETEKNKIVDLIQKAKSIISRRVEKVIGKKPRAEISNEEALQTVLESWVGQEEEKEQENKAEEEKYIRDQRKQITEMRDRGDFVPVNYMPCPEVSVEEHEEKIINKDISNVEGDVSTPTSIQRSFTPTFTSMESVRHSWSFLNENELYPPKLRRPSSLYGAEAATASSRLPSRQLSLSPSCLLEHADAYCSLSSTEEPMAPSTHQAELEETTGDIVEEAAPNIYRPASYIVPIGGVWNPEDRGVESLWSEVHEEGKKSPNHSEASDQKGLYWAVELNLLINLILVESLRPNKTSSFTSKLSTNNINISSLCLLILPT